MRAEIAFVLFAGVVVVLTVSAAARGFAHQSVGDDAPAAGDLKSFHHGEGL
jgi:hypothetical protein